MKPVARAFVATVASSTVPEYILNLDENPFTHVFLVPTFQNFILFIKWFYSGLFHFYFNPSVLMADET